MERIQRYKQIIGEEVRKAWAGFALREKLLIVGGTAVLVIIGLVEVLASVQETFLEQEATLQSAQQKLNDTVLEMGKYQKLKTRYADIESAFKNVEMKEFMLSYLERLVRDKAGVSSGFVITDRPVRPFGGKYEQVPYSVKFAVSDMGKLITFLNDVEHGEHPLIVASIDLKRKQGNEGLNVELEVSSLRERTNNSEDA